MAASQGVIQFHGSIVEFSCESVARRGALMELKDCPLANRGSQFEARQVDSVKALGNATTYVKLVGDSGNGRYYDQRYVLVDGHGKPVQSGYYVITMSSP